MKSICKIIFLLAITVFFAGCQPEHDPYASYRKYDAPALYAQAEKMLAKNDYVRAVESLEALEILYPFGPHAEQTQLYLIYAYYQKKDMGAVAASADHYIRLYPRSASVPYVYYMKAMANYHHQAPILQHLFGQDQAHRDLKLAEQSFEDFKFLTEHFPDSPYGQAARQYLAHLLDQLARSEWYAAEYYYRRGAYVAAANRANYITDHYPQSLETAKALALMVRSYRQLLLPHKAAEALAVLELNYPHSKELAELLQEKSKPSVFTGAGVKSPAS